MESTLAFRPAEFWLIESSALIVIHSCRPACAAARCTIHRRGTPTHSLVQAEASPCPNYESIPPTAARRSCAPPLNFPGRSQHFLHLGPVKQSLPADVSNFQATATRAIFGTERLRSRASEFARPTSSWTIFIAALASRRRNQGDSSRVMGPE